MLEFVGPLPPPVHGFAWVNQQMLSGLQKRTGVRVRDRAWPRTKHSGLRKPISVIAGFCQWLVFFPQLLLAKPKALYIGCSGGAGMLVDAPFVFFAKLFGVPVYVHHHAFSYLNSSTPASRVCLRQMRSCQHLVLCSYMGQLLNQVHGIPFENIVVLSNAAFLNAQQNVAPKTNVELVIGFLSNITVEKGIFDFFDLAAQFVNKPGSPEFLVAGPVSPAVQNEFAGRLKALPNVRHVGPVYGSAKDSFFQSLDVLAFPTRYANEAEPVTILEAFSAGVPVIANHRGCIPSMLDETSGLGVIQAADFVTEAAKWISGLIDSPEKLAALKAGAKARFLALHTEHAANLNKFLDRIAAGLPLADPAP